MTNSYIFKIIYQVWSFAKTDFQRVPPVFKFPQSSSIQNQLPLLKEIVVSLSSFKHWLTVFGYVLVDVPGAEKNGTSWKHMPHLPRPDPCQLQSLENKRFHCKETWHSPMPMHGGVDLSLARHKCSSSLCLWIGIILWWGCSIWVFLQQWRKDCMWPRASLSQSNDWFKLSLIQMSMHWMHLRWRSRMVMIWYFDNKSPLYMNTFLAIYLKWTIVEPGWCFSSFFCHWMFLNFSVLPPKITFDCDILPSFRIFGSVLHDYCSMEAALVQYQILLKEVMLNQKVCLLFMINYQNFVMSIFVGLSCI